MAVTSRTAGYHDELIGFTRVEVMEFDDRQVKGFIGNWFGKTRPQKADTLLKAVMANDNIKTLARSPLMITIIAVIYEEDRELPRHRSDLYRRAVDVLLSKWDIAKKIKNRYSTEQKEFILRKLAYTNHCDNLRTRGEAEILALMQSYSQRLGLKEEDCQPLLEEIWQRSYLLRQVSMETYDFLHLSFQEYFTALEVREQPGGLDILMGHVHEPWWEEPILLYAGIAKDAEPLIKRIREKVPGDIFHSNLLLSGKCIADAEFTDTVLKEEISRELRQKYENGRFFLLRWMSWEVLRRVDPAWEWEFLLKRLNDNDQPIRFSAAEALGQTNAAEAIPALLQTLADDKDSYVRGHAAKALGQTNAAGAIPALLRALVEDKEIGVRWSAAEALGNIGTAEAISPLVIALNDEGKTNIYLEQGIELFRLEVKDAAYEALYKISRRCGVRITQEMVDNFEC